MLCIAPIEGLDRCYTNFKHYYYYYYYHYHYYYYYFFFILNDNNNQNFIHRFKKKK